MIIFQKDPLAQLSQLQATSLVKLIWKRAKTNLIVGTNGAGKSTILDALTFSLFGKPFRKINKPLLVNSINEKDCLTEIEFSIGRNEYKVIRGIKPNKFEIYCDGQIWNQRAQL
jgi:DNA repair exonuclease SbcCD ATPase subunit